MSESETLVAETPSAEASNDQYFRAIVEGMRDAVYVRDKDRTILYMNPAAEELTGWSVSETKVHPCYRIFGDPDQRCNLECPVDQAVVDDQFVRHKEGTVTTRAGEVIPVEVSITPLSKDAGNARAVVILRDITRMRQLEDAHMNVLREFEASVRELKRNETRFHDFAEVSNEWLWETDTEHRFTLMTGKSFFAREDYIGKRREDLVDIETDKARWEPFFKCLANKEPFTDFIYPAQDANGKSGWVSISGKPIHDQHGSFIGYRGIGRNVDGDEDAT